VSCEIEKKDKYKRWLARCTVGRQDLGTWLASNGWAIPFRECKCEVIRATAKAARAGIWSSSFQTLWDWRAEHQNGS